MCDCLISFSFHQPCHHFTLLQSVSVMCDSIRTHPVAPRWGQKKKEKKTSVRSMGVPQADPETAYFDTSCKTCIGETQNSHMPFFFLSLSCLLLFSKMSRYRDWSNPAHFLRHLVSPKCHWMSQRERHLGNASAAPHDEAAPTTTRQGRERICFGRSSPWEAKPCLLLRARTFAPCAFRPFGLALASSRRPCHRNRLS